MKEERLEPYYASPVSSRTGRDPEANWQCAYILVKAAPKEDKSKDKTRACRVQLLSILDQVLSPPFASVDGEQGGDRELNNVTMTPLDIDNSCSTHVLIMTFHWHSLSVP
jgi:hypothetical protein